MNVQQLVMAVQKKLGVTVDGHPGPETWQAIYRSVVGADAAPPPHAQDPVDDRSETSIVKLQPPVQPYARALVHAAAAAGIEIKVISGFRSYKEQDALFAQGRTKPGRKVTNCKGGESNHNFGVAFDIGVFDGKHYLPESPSYSVWSKSNTIRGRYGTAASWKALMAKRTSGPARRRDRARA